MSWLQAVERLNRTAPTELTAALRQRHELVSSATELAVHRVAPPLPWDLHDPGGCPDPRCVFHATPDGVALCTLVATLARVGAPDRPPSASSDVEALLARFLRSLEGAMDAVRYCRLTEHPAGRCWFTVAGREQPICGEVLRLAHRRTV